MRKATHCNHYQDKKWLENTLKRFGRRGKTYGLAIIAKNIEYIEMRVESMEETK